MKKFNLEEAKAGKPVCTRDGRNARIICFDMKTMVYCLCVLIEDRHGEEEVYYYDEQGSLFGDANLIKDWQLMMKAEKKTGWVYLYKPFDSTTSTSRIIYENKEKAEKAGKLSCGYVGVAKIEWEE